MPSPQPDNLLAGWARGEEGKSGDSCLGRVVTKAQVSAWLLRNEVTIACWPGLLAPGRALVEGCKLGEHPGKASVCQEDLDLQGGDSCLAGAPSSLVIELGFKLPAFLYSP